MFLNRCLIRRTFVVKLGSTLSLPRPLHAGFVQGSVLSRVLFSLGMVRRVISSDDQHTHEYKFLGLILYGQGNHVAQARFTIAATRGPANATNRLSSTKWDDSPAALLHLPEALAVSRICYSMQFYSPSSTQRLNTERVHSAAIW